MSNTTTDTRTSPDVTSGTWRLDPTRSSVELHAAGRHVPVDVEAAVREVGSELEVEATTLVDHRELGLTWSPLGIMRSPSKLIVRGRLSRTEATR